MLKLLLIISTLFCLLAEADSSLAGPLKSIAVQSRGRVKPLDTFARDTLRFITGKETFNKRPATDVLISWMLLPKHWHKTEFILVQSSILKKSLGLELKKVRFSPSELLENKSLIQELVELRVRQQNKEALDDYFKAVQKLENRLTLYQAFKQGRVPGWIPATPSGKEKSWRSLIEIKQTEQEHNWFQNIILSYVEAVSAQKLSLEEGKKKQRKLEKAVKSFKENMQSQYPVYKKHQFKLRTELHYNELNPFRISWMFYLMGFLFLFLKILFKKKPLFYITLIWWGGAFLVQAYGMILRSLVMGRPPVTNMYETVVWVPWVTVILGMLLWWRYRAFMVFVCSCAVAFFCLLLTDSAPVLLDGRLEPLEAVLRSNFWLSTHVIIITMSYAAFFLAFAIGDVLLFKFLRGDSSRIKSYVACIDRSLQVGVVLLAAGTILGGIWADYSWGRFWGWDPKETWALISLLGYLALLHGRLVGWVKEFGLAVGSVLIFFLIVMAWYGVNYVLGQGLHSYGFGAGGVEYVSGFALLHLIYVLLVWTLRPQKFFT